MTTLEGLGQIMVALQNQVQTLMSQLTHHETLIGGLSTRVSQREAQRESRGLDESDDDVMPDKPKDLDEREFRSCPVFKGETAEWDNWTHVFATCAHKVPGVQRNIEEVLKQSGKVDELNDLVLDRPIMEQYRGAVYHHLVKLTTGEAATLVRTAPLKTGGIKCGFGALALLAQRYNPKTPVRVLHHWGQVIDPPKIKDVRRLQASVEQWDVKRSKLATEYGEVMSEFLQTAIFVKMLPKDLQDIAFQISGDKNLEYKVIRERIVSIANNRAYDMTTPVPMDVGCVDEKSSTDDEHRGSLK